MAQTFLTLANCLTLTRLAAVIPIVMLILIDSAESRWLAAGLYLIACLTDALDGWAARALGQESYWGRCLDPIVDKILTTSTSISLLVTDSIGQIGAIAVIVILAREFLISDLRQALTEQRFFLSVSRLAKWKTLLQMVALLVLILDKMVIYAALMGEILLVATSFMSIITALIYVRRAWPRLMHPHETQN